MEKTKTLARRSGIKVIKFIKHGVLAQHKNLLIIGGSSNLGHHLLPLFSKTWKIVNIDKKENKFAHVNILLNKKRNGQYTSNRNVKRINKYISSMKIKFDAIICTAGKYQHGSIKNVEIFDQMKKMYDHNVWPALLTGHLATKHLGQNGLLLLTGAESAFSQPLTKSLAYSLAKTQIHSLTMSLAMRKDLTKDSDVVGILPTTFDSKANRKAFPDLEIDEFLRPEALSGLIKMWADGSNRPSNGSLAVIKSVNGSAVTKFV